MTTEKYYDKIVEVCLDIGEKRVSKIQEHQRLLELYGLVGLRNKHFLNALLSNGKCNYLELGVYRGAALACALYKNPEVKVYAVDNWHYSPIDHPAIRFEPDLKTTIPWPNVKMAAEDNISKFVTQKVTLLDKNWVDLKKSDIPDPINIVHLHPMPGVTKLELTSYLNALYPLLEVTSILVMEMHQIELVPPTIEEWCKTKKIKIFSKREKRSDSLSNGDHWWGGLGVYVLEKQEITK